MNRDPRYRFSFRVSDYLDVVCINSQVSKYKGYILKTRFFLHSDRRIQDYVGVMNLSYQSHRVVIASWPVE